jgi:hypothetical protein
MKNSARCHACRKEVDDIPRVCPHCAAPNPTYEYSVMKPIVAAVSVVILLSIIADVRHNRRPEYVAGETYPIVKDGPVCLTLNGLTKANARGGNTSDEWEQLGCLALATDPNSQAKVLDTNASVAKVVVFAPKLPVNNFEGWTAVDNLGPEPEPENTP